MVCVLFRVMAGNGGRGAGGVAGGARTEGDLPLVNQFAKVDLFLLVGLRVVHLALAPPRVQLPPPRRGGRRADTARAVTSAVLGVRLGPRPQAARLNLDAKGVTVEGADTARAVHRL
jgi:hypothetical protein